MFFPIDFMLSNEIYNMTIVISERTIRTLFNILVWINESFHDHISITGETTVILFRLAVKVKVHDINITTFHRREYDLQSQTGITTVNTRAFNVFNVEPLDTI